MEVLLLFRKQYPLNFISLNGYELIKVGAKLLSEIVIFSMLSSDNPFNFHDKTGDLLVQNLKYFLVDEILSNFVIFLKKYILLHKESYIHLLNLL